MASGGDIEEREFRGFQGSQASEALKHRTHSVTEKNMKEVDLINKEEINKRRSSVGRPAQNYSKSETSLVQEEDVSRAGERRELAEGL
ncbi:hypothetical protein SKAU_G00190480 [Synaphobranchus kaupii]|uniref:Uncharacterized protein n=1 Tax=Synaphobranchus kaupii TaxID=118154 RepID=A0A9Q1FDL1_SYNKA|nr:hypothetical protein SKAU_G00190480 [Synaphobranchus kaupii]